MKYVHKFFLAILPYVARIHPKNWGKDYPQLWYCVPFKRWKESKTETYPNGHAKLYRRKPRQIVEEICGFLTGHERSETEMGFGGGEFMDCNCRWCDISIKIPKSECFPSKFLKDLMPLVGKEIPPSAPDENY